MDNYQSQNVIMYLEKIASLLQTQNEILKEIAQPKVDPKTERLQGLQEIIAQENRSKG
jgi:hypothetical protein